MQPSAATKEDIVNAAVRLGIGSADILLVHSSLKALGYVHGGPDAVIDGLQEVLTPKGTLVFPTFVQRDFENAYKNWNVATSPSDVGLITEIFRRRAGVSRSDQATHSVAAWGAEAEAITGEHGAWGKRQGVYGDTPFAAASPWQKMYDSGGKVLFLGVPMRSNTYHHFVEYRLVEELLAKAPETERSMLADMLAKTEEEYARQHKIWPFLNGDTMLAFQSRFLRSGLMRTTRCADAQLSVIEIRPMVDILEKEAREHPGDWFSPEACAWICRCTGVNIVPDSKTVALQTQTYRYLIDPDGANGLFLTVPGSRQLLTQESFCAELTGEDGQLYRPQTVRKRDNVLHIRFQNGAKIQVGVDIRQEYIVFSLLQVEGSFQKLAFVNLPTENDALFAVSLLGLHTNTRIENNRAQVFAQTGWKGAKAALIAVPAQLLDQVSGRVMGV